LVRILLAAKHAPHGPRPTGGVQSWCRTVASELADRGHDVVTWGPGQTTPLGGFDLGIIANATDTARAFAWCRKRIVISHGIIPAEDPRPDRHGSPVVYTSEGVRDHWGGAGQIIRQPINLDFWKPAPALRAYLTRFSYRGGLNFVRQLAGPLKLSYVHVKNSPPIAVRSTLRRSACVLATGRAALEAMACGAPTVLCDHRSAYQRPLMDLDLTTAAERNYSGRGGIVPTLNNTREAIEQAIERGSMRNYVKKYHAVADIVDQLLEAAG